MKEEKQWCEKKCDECKKKLTMLEKMTMTFPTYLPHALTKLLNTMSKYDSSIF
jgi:hypothetical protein